jgi:hypothetical protein
LGIVSFSSLNEGDEFRDVAMGERHRKLSVHRAEIADCVTGEFQGETKFFVNDFDVFLCKRATVETPELKVAHDTLRMLEVMMQDVVGEYDVPEEVPEWHWVQQNASFSHVRNAEDGVWEFMVNVERFVDSADTPERLKPLFKKARLHKAAWMMFHQGT